MLIESLIRRTAGTIVPMDRETYHFKPQAGTHAHVCEVTNQRHIARFLAIPEGYAVFAAELPEGAKALADTIADAAETGDLAKVQFTAAELAGLGDDFGTELADPAAMLSAPLDAKQLVAELNAQDEAEGEAEDGEDLTTERVNAMDEEELRATYAAMNGRAAPSNTKPETLREKLIELIEA